MFGSFASWLRLRRAEEAYCSDLGRTEERTGYLQLDYLLKVSEGLIECCTGMISDPKVDVVLV